jgi:hypothetical protein
MIVPASWKEVSPVNVTSDSKVASPPGVGCSVLRTPSVPFTVVRVQLGLWYGP